MTREHGHRLSVRRGLLPAVAVTLLLALYVWAVAGRAFALMSTGTTAGIGIGIAALVLPLFVIALIAREWWLALTVQTMADTLAAAGELPIDTLPRSPSGRIDRKAADAEFETYRVSVEENPEDWKCWYRLAFAYDASHDRRRARESLRQAATIYRRVT